MNLIDKGTQIKDNRNGMVLEISNIENNSISLMQVSSLEGFPKSQVDITFDKLKELVDSGDITVIGFEQTESDLFVVNTLIENSKLKYKIKYIEDLEAEKLQKLNKRKRDLDIMDLEMQIDEDEKKMHGGLAHGKSVNDIAKKHGVDVDDIELELGIGTKVEMEHTDNKKIAQSIAKDHLWEDAEYYTKLKNMALKSGGIVDSKIKMKEIIIKWAEGDNGKYDNFPKSYNSWEKANEALVPVFIDNLDSEKKYGGGYNKSAFVVKFKDGEVYEGRLDISSKEDNPTTTKNVIGKHIKKFLDYEVKRNSADKNEIEEWIKKYDLGLSEQDKDKPKAKKLNGYLVRFYRSDYKSSLNIVSNGQFDSMVLVTDGIGGTSATVMSDEPYLKFKKKNVGSEEYLYCEPVNVGNEGDWRMFGGSFVYTSDSRFSKEVSKQPIPVHDRVEKYMNGGKLNLPKFMNGEIVWDSGNKSYGIVLNNYEGQNNYGEIRLDSDGNQPIENLHKLGSKQDKGTKKQLQQALLSHKKLVDEWGYEKIGYKKGGKIKVSDGIFGSKEFWRVTHPKIDTIGIFPKEKYSEEKAKNGFIEKFSL